MLYRQLLALYTPGPDSDDDADEVAATVAPGGALVLLTLAGLTQPGAVASFKVFVITSTGNTAGTPAMQITRPPASAGAAQGGLSPARRRIPPPHSGECAYGGPQARLPGAGCEFPPPGLPAAGCVPGMFFPSQ